MDNGFFPVTEASSTLPSEEVTENQLHTNQKE